MGTHVMLVEDDDDVRLHLQQSLTEATHLEVFAVPSANACLKKLEDVAYKPDAVIIDLHIKAGAGGDHAFKGVSSHERRGFSLARRIHGDRPDLPLFAITGLMDGVTPDCHNWFKQVGDKKTNIGVYHKQREWVLLRHRVFKLTGQPSPVTVFLVHGHDHGIRDELRKMANDLNWNVEILGEEDSQNRAWFDRFEKMAHQASLAWILFTPDEWGLALRPDRDPERRARPNVILECGYFLGAFGRYSNRVLLFKKGNVKLPGDLEGVQPIDLVGSVAAEKDKILGQLRPWL